MLVRRLVSRNVYLQYLCTGVVIFSLGVSYCPLASVERGDGQTSWGAFSSGERNRCVDVAFDNLVPESGGT